MVGAGLKPAPTFLPGIISHDCKPGSVNARGHQVTARAAATMKYA